MAISTRKMGIRKHFLLQMTSAVLLSFAVLAAVLLMNMTRVQDVAMESGRDVVTAAGDFTEALAEDHAKQKLLIEVTENAHHANQELADIAENVKYISLAAGKILSNPGAYLPRTVKSAGRDAIHPSECYAIYGPAARAPEGREAAAEEIRVLSNIADTLEHCSIYYSKYATSCFVTSEKDFHLAAESFEGEVLDMPQGLAESYRPKERPYYIEAIRAGTLINQVFEDALGRSSVYCAMPYTVGGEVAGVGGVAISLASLYHDITEKTIGASGAHFALNRNGEVVFSSEKEGTLAARAKGLDLRTVEYGALAQAALAMTEGKSGVVPLTLDGQEYYLAYAPMPVFQWSFASLARKDEVVSGVQAAKEDVLDLSKGLISSIHGYFMGMFRQMAIFMAVIFVLLVFLSPFAADFMVRPLLALTEGVGEIAKGNLDAKLNVKTGDEMEDLSDSINQMTEDLKVYIENLSRITEEEERIRTELDLAREIQEGMLPSAAPFADNPRFDLAATMEAAKMVGGDFYDFYLLDDEHLALTMADVSGKGIPASLFMVISKTVLKIIALSEHRSADFGHAMELANRRLCENNEEMMFVTVFFGVLNLRTGEFVYVNGGHNPPLVGRAQGGSADWQYIVDEKKSHMVGVLEDAAYEERRLALAPGDMLYFYTDGVTEAMDPENRLYTEERLKETLNRAAGPGATAKDVLAAVRADVDAHANGAEQSDDITMLAIRFLGPGA